jgi:pyridoxal biosynthesis lyase PdxS
MASRCLIHRACCAQVVNFAAGGVATPADAALMMQLGVDGVFVGSGIFKSGNPAKRAAAIVQAVTHYKDPNVLASVSEDLGEAMVGLNCDQREEWAGRESGMPAKSNYQARSFTRPAPRMPLYSDGPASHSIRFP